MRSPVYGHLVGDSRFKVIWLFVMPKIKIAWILSVDRNTASSRLQGYLIHEWMVKMGVCSEIVAINACKLNGVWSYKFFDIARNICSGNFTHVVFEGPEWAAFQISVLCKLWGLKTICVRCDNLKADYDSYFDVTILPTKMLADSLGVLRRCIVPDCVEVPPSKYKRDYSLTTSKIRVVWVGHQGYADYILGLISKLRGDEYINNHFDFVLISKGDFATVQWSLDNVFDDILGCDVALIPVPEGEWYAGKSSNRLAMMMALGMPVVATAIPSYEDIAVAARDVIFVDDGGEMVEALLRLSSEEARSSLGQSARENLGDRFSINTIAPMWLRSIGSAVDFRSDMPPRSFAARVLAIFIRVFSKIW